jgi:integrase
VLGKTGTTTRVSFGTAVEQFLETHQVRPSTLKDYRRILHGRFLPKLRLEQMDRVRTQDLARIIDRLAATPAEARYTYATASVFFRWALGRHLIEHNPLAGLKAPKTSPSRERVLTDDELGIVFAAAVSSDTTIARIIQLLILTGQRRGEITGLRWSDIDEDERTITWPGELVKNGRQHTIPYGPMAAGIFRAVPRTGELVFPARGRIDRPFSGWSKTGLAFVQSCDIEPWTLYDLRRTFASGMQKLGVRIEITEKLLNHVSGSFAGIVSVYQRHSYLSEMRDALQSWESHVQALRAKRESANGSDLPGLHRKRTRTPQRRARKDIRPAASA